MTPEQIKLVQESWKKVLPIKETAAELFYGKLFEIAPQVQPLFKNTTLQKQGAKLMSMINSAVMGLDNPKSIASLLEDSGKRHVGYGVQDRDYEYVGAALLWTLEQGLQDGFTPQVAQAWKEVYAYMASTMKNAAHRA
jgi:hemoglobin-like flavoprotein